jgi:hypothetical protein
MSVIQST